MFFIYKELMGILLHGVEKHLHSPIQNLRTLGMVVGENLMNDLNPFNMNEKTEKKEKKLKFDVIYFILLFL
jgi:hypothetical protein